MVSINTNVSAMAALSTLRSINQGMEQTQSNISSGYKVKDAKDNAAYWSIATTMRSDNNALATVKDALGLGAAKTDVAYTAMNSSIKVVDEIKTKLVAASEPGVDKSKVQKEIKELQNQLKSIATSASFSGENWIAQTTGGANDATTKQIVGSFNRNNLNQVSVTTLSFDTHKSQLVEVAADGSVTTSGAATGLLTQAMMMAATDGAAAGTAMATAANASMNMLTIDITATGVNLDELISGVDFTLQKMTDSAADLGALSKRIDMQSEFIQNLSDSIDKGVGRLVDADMNEESTKLKALQTQQQLGIQALSIANSDSQNVLSLFR